MTTTTTSSRSARTAFDAGDIAQIDLDRIELQRVQYESELQTAIVNLRTAKIQLLQLLNDRTPVEQFDLEGPFDFSDQLQPLDSFRQIALDNRPDLRAALQTIQQSETNHKLAISNGSTDPTFGAWYTYNSSNNNANGIQTLGLSVRSRCASSTATRARSSAPSSISTAAASQRSHPRPGLLRRRLSLRAA